MTALILAGGKGTRLLPFTITIPKPLLPVGEVPIIEVILRQLAAAGVSRVIISVGHLAHLFTALVGNGVRFGLTVEYSFEDEPLGTAGPIRLVKNLEEELLVMNGDLLTTVSYSELFETHRRMSAWGTIAVHQREVNVDYGVVRMTDDGRLSDYIEKPIIPYFVSMGINVISRQAVEFIPPVGKFDMPQLLMALQGAGKTVACYRTDSYWQDIGRFDDYQQASSDFVADPTRFLPAGYPCRQH